MRQNIPAIVISVIALGVALAAVMSRNDTTVSPVIVERVERVERWHESEDGVVRSEADAGLTMVTRELSSPHSGGLDEASSVDLPTLAESRAETVERLRALEGLMFVGSSGRAARVRETEISDALGRIDAVFDVSTVRCGDQLCQLDVIVPPGTDRELLLTRIADTVPRGEMFAGHDLEDVVPPEGETVQIFIALPGENLPATDVTP